MSEGGSSSGHDQTKPKLILQNSTAARALSDYIFLRMESDFGPSLKLGFDIWHEITNILADERKSGALLALALTSRTLSAIALPALWRHMTYTLHPVVFSINSFALKSDPFLVYKSTGSKQFLITSTPLPESARLRILQYLSYVRSYEYDYLLNGQDAQLWPVLSHWLGSEGPLFPNLKHLLVQWDFRRSQEGPLLDTFLSILSPTIHDLTLRTCNSAGGSKFTSGLLERVEIQGCRLTRFQFRGKAYPDLRCAPMAFEDVQHLSIHTAPGADRIPPSISAFKCISSFPSLSSFSCDDRAFTVSFIRAASTTPFHHSLKTLRLRGSVHWIEQLVAGMRFPSLLELCILVTDGRFRGKTFSQILACHSPILRGLEIKYISIFEPFPSFTDLTPLFALPLETLNCRLSDAFTSSDFEMLLTACLRLRKLILPQNTACHGAVRVLSIAAQHPNLEELSMRIDTSSLFVPIERRSNSDTGYSRLKKLSFRGGVIPLELSVREIMARNLVQLFPNITTVLTNFHQFGVEDLERLIWQMKSV